MIRYAQLDDDGKVIGISYLTNIVEDESLIEIEEDFNPWGKKFDRTENSWIDVRAEETTPPQAPTLDEKIEEINETQSAIMMSIVDLFEMGGML